MAIRFHSNWLPPGCTVPEHKYGAKPVEVDGIKFPSTKEANYYSELKLLKQAGEILGFSLQPEFDLQPAFTTKDGEKIQAIKYRADFLITYPDGSQKVVDVKGYKTDVYKLKKKMLLYRYPLINFEEV